jgi:hypothetical protein
MDRKRLVEGASCPFVCLCNVPPSKPAPPVQPAPFVSVPPHVPWLLLVAAPGLTKAGHLLPSALAGGQSMRNAAASIRNPCDPSAATARQFKESSGWSTPARLRCLVSDPHSLYRSCVGSRPPRGARSPSHPARSPSVFTRSDAADSANVSRGEYRAELHGFPAAATQQTKAPQQTCSRSRSKGKHAIYMLMEGRKTAKT